MNSKSDNNRTQKLFLAALEIPEAERDAWLTEQCGEDKQLLAEVRSLLQHDALTNDPLEQGLSPSALPNADLDEPDYTPAVNGTEVESEIDLPVGSTQAMTHAPAVEMPLPTSAGQPLSAPEVGDRVRYFGEYELL